MIWLEAIKGKKKLLKSSQNKINLDRDVCLENVSLTRYALKKVISTSPKPDRNKVQSSDDKKEENTENVDNSNILNNVRRVYQNHRPSLSAKQYRNCFKGGSNPISQVPSFKDEEKPKNVLDRLNIHDLNNHERGILGVKKAKKVPKSSGFGKALTKKEYEKIFDRKSSFYEKKAFVGLIRKKWKVTKGYCSKFEKIPLYRLSSKKSRTRIPNPDITQNLNINQNVGSASAINISYNPDSNSRPGSVVKTRNYSTGRPLSSSMKLARSSRKRKRSEIRRVQNELNFSMKGRAKKIHHPYSNLFEEKSVEKEHESHKINLDIPLKDSVMMEEVKEDK
ncbi:unnamed protein product [Moneuplotes crassus]|uniref:Uncharacterized protein n=1 Tax=Euplotes crassus TaxID=5936 RepID=A0AAD1UAH6_EUPCR|nr:unnamed protein product [Moneuplotes crassus]